MAVLLTDDSFNRLTAMHLYAERVMNHFEPTELELEAIMHFNILISQRVCASEEDADPRDGAERIADERMRQIGALNWSDEHDDGHDRGELAYAAVCYAAPPWERERDWLKDMWPWDDTDPADTPKPGAYSQRDTPENVTTRMRELEKAGALIAAEIDRLDRLANA